LDAPSYIRNHKITLASLKAITIARFFPEGLRSIPILNQSLKQAFRFRKKTADFRRFFVLAACALLVLAFAPAQYFARQNDDLLYLTAAKALLTGRYCLFTTPGCPALTDITPGWPALLAPLALFTERPALFQALAALLLAACPAALWAWLRRRAPEDTALLAAALFAASPLVLSQSGTLMPEVPYLLVFLATLAAVEDGRAGAVGTLAALLLQIRPAGLSALPAMILPPLRARRWRQTALAAGPALLGAAAWSAWSWSKISAVVEVGEFDVSYRGQVWSKPFRNALANADFYLSSWGGSHLPPRWADQPIALALGAALVVVAAWGLLRALRRRLDDPAAWALLGGAFMHAVWAWQYERYMITLLPLLLWAAAEGLGRFAKPVFLVLLLMTLGAQTVPRLGQPSPWAEPELARTYAWLKSQPGPGVLVSALYARDGYFSQRPSAPLPDREKAEAFCAGLKKYRARWVLRQDGLDVGLTEPRIARLQSRLDRAFGHLADTRLFRKVYANPAERSAVYEPR